jgi:hypothetical protein
METSRLSIEHDIAKRFRDIYPVHAVVAPPSEFTENNAAPPTSSRTQPPGALPPPIGFDEFGETDTDADIIAPPAAFDEMRVSTPSQEQPRRHTNGRPPLGATLAPPADFGGNVHPPSPRSSYRAVSVIPAPASPTLTLAPPIGFDEPESPNPTSPRAQHHDGNSSEFTNFVKLLHDVAEKRETRGRIVAPTDEGADMLPGAFYRDGRGLRASSDLTMETKI